MLPDIPKTKLELSQRFMVYVRRKIDSDHAVLASIKTFTQHEGKDHEYEQVGFGNVSEGYTEIGTPFSVNIDEIPEMFGPKLQHKLDEIAAEIGKQSMQLFFKKIDETIEKAGNKVESPGPITADKLLQLVEMTQVEFDASGNPTSSFLMHPSMVETAKSIDEQIKNDPELKARSEAIRRKHYDEWLARENNRKLVD